MRQKVLAIMVLVALGMAVASTIGGCTASGRIDPATIERTWVLESFGAAAGLSPADPSVTTEMTLESGKATGSGGVNSFTGRYEAFDDGRIRFGQPAATMMAGPPAAMEQESTFFSAMEKATRFEINQGKLVLSDSDNNTLLVMAPK